MADQSEKTSEQVAAEYRKKKNKELLTAVLWGAGIVAGIYVVSKIL